MKQNLCDALGHYWQHTMAANVDRCRRGCGAIRRWDGRQWVVETPKSREEGSRRGNIHGVRLL